MAILAKVVAFFSQASGITALHERVVFKPQIEFFAGLPGFLMPCGAWVKGWLSRRPERTTNSIKWAHSALFKKLFEKGCLNAESTMCAEFFGRSAPCTADGPMPSFYTVGVACGGCGNCNNRGVGDTNESCKEGIQPPSPVIRPVTQIAVESPQSVASQNFAICQFVWFFAIL